MARIPYSITFDEKGNFEWPQGWDLERKIQELDLSRRDYHTQTAAAPFEVCTRQARWIANRITEEIGRDRMLALAQDLKTHNDQMVPNLEQDEDVFARMLPAWEEEDRSLHSRMAVTRRMTDPPLPAPLFRADGSIKWPKDWGLDRMIREIDWSRRSGTPGLEPLPIEDHSFVQWMVEDLKKSHDPELIDEKILDIEEKNNARWGSKKRKPHRTTEDIIRQNREARSRDSES